MSRPWCAWEEAMGSFLQGCTALEDLALGGANLAWREEMGLAAFSGLTSLHLARRVGARDEQLAELWRRNQGLRHVTLAGEGGRASCARSHSSDCQPLCSCEGCCSLTDATIQMLPAGLEVLRLPCCEEVQGRGLPRLRRLQELRLPGCNEILPASVTACVAHCPRLRVLELPGHLLAREVIPMQAQGHIRGLFVEGGRVEHTKLTVPGSRNRLVQIQKH